MMQICCNSKIICSLPAVLRTNFIHGNRKKQKNKLCRIKCYFTLSRRSPYHIETSPLICMHWFLYDRDLCHEKIKGTFSACYYL